MSSSNATCYLNDGSVATGDFFCGFSNRNTCCGLGWSCLSNGLCQQSSGTKEYAQGSCTDPSFKKCLSFCNYAQPGNFTVVNRCEPAGNSWCFECALQNPNGIGCCGTNRTTTLKPYPFTTGTLTQSPVDSSSSMTSISYITELTPNPSSSSDPGTSLQSIEAIIKTTTQTSATPSEALTSSSSTQPTHQSHNSKMNIYIGITVAVVVILLAVLAFFIFQNRKFKQRFRKLIEGPSGQEETTTAVRRGVQNPPVELDLTHYELAQQGTLRHELSGNGIHEIYHLGIPEHELIRDRSQR